MRPGFVQERLDLFHAMAGVESPPAVVPSPPRAPNLAAMPPTLPRPADAPPTAYTVHLSTADTKWAGTDRDVYLMLVGDSYATDYIHLTASAGLIQTSMRYAAPGHHPPVSARPEFPKGSIRECRFRATSVGNIVKIIVRHDPADSQAAAWKLDRVLVIDDRLQRTWTFLCKRWLSREMGNVVELRPLAEIGAGQRASRRASKRLSAPARDPDRDDHRTREHGPLAHRFADARSVFGPDAQGDPLSNVAATGTKRVCFQLQKHTANSSHVYLMGEIPALGAWNPTSALRMTMHTGGDGTWRGEWRLELEIDDDFDDIQYTYMIVTETGEDGLRHLECPDRLRRLKLSAPDSLGRITEGGRVHIRDTFGHNRFGFTSSSRPSYARCVRAFKDHAPVPTPSGAAILRAGILGPQSTRSSSPVEGVPRNFHSDLDNASEEQSFQSDLVDEREAVESDEDRVAVLSSPSQVAPTHPGDTHMRSSRGVSEILPPRLSPREQIEREEEAARRDWKEALEESDGQLFKSAQRLLRRKPEVTYLKKRNSREVDATDLLLSAEKSQGKSSPVSSDGMADEEESFMQERQERGVLPLSHSARQAPLRGELMRLKEEVQLLEEQRKQKETLYNDVKATYEAVKEELDVLRREMSVRCEEYGTQHAELVKLVMDGQEAYKAASDQLIAERDQLETRWKKEFKARRKLFNTIQELRGNIRVFCRVRPLKEATLTSGLPAKVAVSFPDAAADDENSIIQIGPKCFEFDHVFPPVADQKAVYDETAGVVASVLDGYNVCVFAYGQTGSGKTHTMSGPEEDRGVNYRALVDLFDIANQRSEFQEVNISVSMVEIYNENLRDLIRGNNKSTPPKLDIRKDPSSQSPNAVHVPNLTEITVDSVEAVWGLMERGSQNRRQGKTNMNEHSSRSHLILKVMVTCEDYSSGVKSSGLLHLVDLAGSERVGRSNVSGERLKEAQHINKSLATLGDVFMSLLSHNNHVPYRNSKLTYLLQDALGGDSKTLMFVNVSADDSDSSETLSSLQFAQRVAKVELGSARKHTEKTEETRALASLQTKETELREVKSKNAELQREVQRRNDVASESKQRTHSLELELKRTKAKLEDQSRKEDAGREGYVRSAQELRELKALHERDQTELRAAKLKVRDVASAKDDEISRLTALLKSRDKKIADMAKQQTSKPPMERANSTPTNRFPRPMSTPTVTRKIERGQASKLPRNATFAGRSRQVRFDEPKTDTSAAAGGASEEAAVRPPATPMSAARRTVDRRADSKLPRSQSMVPRVANRPSGRVAATPSKEVSYAFGTRVEGKATGVSGKKPVRGGRLPRAQTQLRPAQRVSQLANLRGGLASGSAARAGGFGARRAGSMSNVHRLNGRTTDGP